MDLYSVIVFTAWWSGSCGHIIYNWTVYSLNSPGKRKDHIGGRKIERGLQSADRQAIEDETEDH